MSRYYAVRKKIFSLAVILTGVLAAGFGAAVQAADRFVSSETSTVDCRESGIGPGDTITLEGGNRGNISFRNCFGKSGSRITIRNDTMAANPMVIRASGTGWSFECENCEYVTIDGTGKWAGAGSDSCGMSGDWPNTPTNPQCGIQVICTADAPNALVKMRGSSKNYTIKGVEIDGNFPGTCGSDIQSLNINDHQYSASGEWREGLLITDNYVHNTSRTGMYLGPNWYAVRDKGDLALRNNEVSYNYLTDTGCDGIKLKSNIAGQSSIHHNHVDTTGLSSRDPSTGCTDVGIYLFESGFTDVYNNTVINTARNGIAHFTQQLPSSLVPTVPAKFYNNVVWNSGGNAMNSNRESADDSQPQAIFYNNTIVNPGSVGINIGSTITSGCTVRDNIVAGAGNSSISANGCTKSNNLTGTLASQKFVDAAKGDFNLTASSPARNNGSSNGPTTDHNDRPRQQEGKSDQGALEFGVDETASIPNPPPVFQIL